MLTPVRMKYGKTKMMEAMKNELMLNRKTSVEMVISAPRSRRNCVVPSLALPGLEIIEFLTDLRRDFREQAFILSWHQRFSDTVCLSALFALKTLRSHGMRDSVLQNVFHTKSWPSWAIHNCLVLLVLVGLHEYMRSIALWSILSCREIAFQPLCK